MNEERRKLLESILDKVLDAAPADRAAVIEEHCAGDAADAAFLNRMLEAEARADATSFLESPLRVPSRQFWADANLESSGAVFGPYVLLHLIGQGGMGEVHLAERRDGTFDQRVALKLLPLPTPNLMQRFRRERQILATLEHPNIARLLDGGISSDNVPFFAMEYVDGVHITTYCHDNQLDVREILLLFESICAAVEYAHRSLVVHRDIKPSNVLVTRDGVPKLLDFGIAKVLETSDSPEATRTFARALTPDYAAPEQIRGDAVTTSTDVYSLGIVLYELLTGTRPINSASRESIERNALYGEARPPSVAAGNSTKLRRKQLRGDIDRIVLTAIAREPTRRYRSVEAFSNDIRRHLEGRPISIRGDARIYRFKKFVGRNRPLVLVASLLIVTLVAASVGILWQAQRVSQEAARTIATNEFLRGVFSVADPDVNKGDSISATGMLDRSAARVESGFNDVPDLKADVQDTLGGLYLSLGEYTRAKTLFEQSLSLRKAQGSGDTPAFADSLVQLATANIGLDRYTAAEPQLRQALEILNQAYGAGSPHVSTAMRLLGLCFTTLGRSMEAEPLLQQALQIDQSSGPDTAVPDDLAALAAFDFRIHKFKQSVALYQRALTMYREKLGRENSKSVVTQSELADATFFAGDIGAALAVSRDAAATSKKLFGQDHPLSLRLQRKLAMLLTSNSFYDEAEPMLSDLLSRTRKALGPRHSEVAEVLLVFVEDDFGRGHYEDALAAAQEANAIWRDAFGEKNERLEEGLKDVAACEQVLGQLDAAIRDLTAALELSRSLAGTETITYADLEQTLGKVFLQKGDVMAAEPYCSDAERIARKLSGPSDPLTAEAQFCVAGEALQRADPSRAVEAWQTALATARRAYTDAPLQVERFTYPLIKALTTAGQQSAALSLVNDDIDLRTSQFGQGSVGLASAQALRGVILARLGRKTEAVAELKHALAVCKSHPTVSAKDCFPKLPRFFEDCAASIGGAGCTVP